MLITICPQKAAELASNSAHKAVKWLKDTDTGVTYYWKPEDATHAQVAHNFHIDQYEKGIAVIDG